MNWKSQMLNGQKSTTGYDEAHWIIFVHISDDKINFFKCILSEKMQVNNPSKKKESGKENGEWVSFLNLLPSISFHFSF